MEFKKASETEIEVTKDPVTLPPVKVKHSLKFLKTQALEISQQRDALIAEKERELQEIQTLITECVNLGIKEEPTKVEEE